MNKNKYILKYKIEHFYLVLSRIAILTNTKTNIHLYVKIQILNLLDFK